MPELPDVERNRALVEACVVGSRIVSVDAVDPAVLRNATAAEAGIALRHRHVTGATRIGKWLFMVTDGPIVLIHFGMTGKLLWTARAAALHPYDRISFVTARGELRYNDMRKLRGIWLADDQAHASEIIGPQGPDALTIPRRAFLDLGGRRGSIKAVLMNQAIVAGLGNMLSDEVLWRARLHPARPASSLSGDELSTLHRVTRTTLRSAVAAGTIPRTSRWLSSQRASESPECPRCHHDLEWSQINGRSSLLCPNEQRCSTR